MTEVERDNWKKQVWGDRMLILFSLRCQLEI